MFGITNTFATIPGMVAPIVAGALTPNVRVYYFCRCTSVDNCRNCAASYSWNTSKVGVKHKSIICN